MVRSLIIVRIEYCSSQLLFMIPMRLTSVDIEANG